MEPINPEEQNIMAKKVTLKITSAGGGNYLVVVSGEGFIGAAPNAQVGVRIREL